jgi:uncharacterized MAPEG superfamily protein
MSSSYNSTLQTCLPALGILSIGIQLGTTRARFFNGIVAQPEDKGNWPLRSVLKTLFLVRGESKLSEEENKASVQRYVDLNRNFLENVTPFAALALGVAVTVSDPSPKSVVAVQLFTLARVVHSILFVNYPHQPWRAFAFTPQILANLLLIVELLSQR